MEAKHTPGPWHRNIKPARKYPTVWAGRNTHVAVVVAGAPARSGKGDDMSDEEMEANIDLIAAAPAMLAALYAVELSNDGCCPYCFAADGHTEECVVGCAIADAEGRS